MWSQPEHLLHRLPRIVEAAPKHIGDHQRAPRRYKVALIDDGPLGCRHSFVVTAFLAERRRQSGPELVEQRINRA